MTEKASNDVSTCDTVATSNNNYCFFYSCSTVSSFSDVYNFFVRRVVRCFDNPVFESFSKTSEFIFVHIVPSLVDYIGRTDSGATAVQFNVGFQLAVVNLINWCLTVKGETSYNYQHLYL
jgi:hypothetical protein